VLSSPLHAPAKKTGLRIEPARVREILAIAPIVILLFVWCLRAKAGQRHQPAVPVSRVPVSPTDIAADDRRELCPAYCYPRRASIIDVNRSSKYRA
jgi:hypothetical protein